MTRLIAYCILLIICLANCKEIYVPNLDEPGITLVVNGRINDEPGPQVITLNHAIPFNKDQSFPEQGAIVSVYDQNGAYYNFTESTPGVYVSNPLDFRPFTGRTYTLHIKTQGGKSYISSPQIMQPIGNLDTIYGIMKKISIPTYLDNTVSFESAKGIEFFANLNLSEDPSPYYRFSNNLLIEYIAKPDTSKKKYYCWMTYSSNSFVNILGEENRPSFAQQDLGFIPYDTAYLGVGMEKQEKSGPNGSWILTIYKTVHSFQVSFKQFHINKDIYEYYQAMNSQLQAKQRIFDPLAYQFKGNITCVENPDETVLGVFEVASVQKRTFIYDPTLSETSVKLLETNPFIIDRITQDYTNCLRDTIPSFWTKD